MLHEPKLELGTYVKKTTNKIALKMLTNTTYCWAVESSVTINSFTLVINDFGVKFVGEQQANYLKKISRKLHDITVDRERENMYL